MTVFNPDVPDSQAPNFLGLSKPISQPAADTSLETLFKGVSSIGGQGIKLVDDTIKQSIKNTAANTVNQERDSFISALHGVADKQAPETGSVFDGVYNSADGEDAVAEADKEDLSTLPSQIQQLQGAKKYGKTFYLARLYDLAKSTRMNYPPGYREEVDQAFNQAAGTNIANAYMTSLIQQANAGAAGKTNSELKAALSAAHRMMADGVEGADEKYQELQKTGDYNAFFSWQNKTMQWQWKAKVEADRRLNAKTVDDELKGNVEKEVTDDAQNTVNRLFNQVAAKAGLTPDKIQEIINNPNAQIDSKTAQVYGQVFDAVERQARTELLKRNLEGGVRSRNAILGTDKANGIIDQAMQIFKVQKDGIYSNNTGLVFLSKNINEALTHDNTNKMLTDVRIGPIMQNLQSINKLGGAYGAEFFKAILTDPKATTAFQTYYADVLSKLVTQNTGEPDRTPDEPFTMHEALRDGARKGVKTGAFTQKITVDQIKQLSNPNVPTEIKTNIAKAAFSPQNLPMLSDFQMDYIDPNTKRAVPGRTAVFLNFTSPKVAEGVKQLGSEVVQQYKDWAMQSFGQQLFSREIRDLSQLTNDPSIRLGWDSDHKKFVIQPTGQTPDVEGPARTLRSITRSDNLPYVRATVDRLNSGLQGLANVGKVAGEQDVEAFMLKTMIQSGFGLGENGSVSGLPEQIANSLISSRDAKMSQKANPGQALKDFLSGNKLGGRK